MEEKSLSDDEREAAAEALEELCLQYPQADREEISEMLEVEDREDVEEYLLDEWGKPKEVPTNASKNVTTTSKQQKAKDKTAAAKLQTEAKKPIIRAIRITDRSNSATSKSTSLSAEAPAFWAPPLVQTVAEIPVIPTPYTILPGTQPPLLSSLPSNAPPPGFVDLSEIQRMEKLHTIEIQAYKKNEESMNRVRVLQNKESMLLKATIHQLQKEKKLTQTAMNSLEKKIQVLGATKDTDKTKPSADTIGSYITKAEAKEALETHKALQDKRLELAQLR